jgi:multidrug efflux pump subunit AcrA (membrane-fusion protein)
MRKVSIILVVCISLCACQKRQQETKAPVSPPTVTEQGKKIAFPDDARTLSFFKEDTVRRENMEAVYAAPATVAVTIAAPLIKGGRPTVLFNDTQLGASYAQFLQRLINIRSYNVTLERTRDLSEHGAATGKEVLEAETQLANEEAAITEFEATLASAGFDPDALRTPTHPEAWLMCEVPESQIANIQAGTPCTVAFTAFPDQPFQATVNGIGAEVDNLTRMIKVRVTLANPNHKFQSGMFASVRFLLKEGNVLSVPTASVVNVTGKDYAFVRTSQTTFERREVLLGQQLEGKVTVLHGLDPGDQVVTDGVMELKGLSFGY